MICIKCGKEIASGAKYCSNCGSTIEMLLMKPKKMKKKRIAWLVIVMLTVCIGMAGIAAVMLLDGDKLEETEQVEFVGRGGSHQKKNESIVTEGQIQESEVLKTEDVHGEQPVHFIDSFFNCFEMSADELIKTIGMPENDEIIEGQRCLTYKDAIFGMNEDDRVNNACVFAERAIALGDTGVCNVGELLEILGLSEQCRYEISIDSVETNPHPKGQTFVTVSLLTNQSSVPIMMEMEYDSDTQNVYRDSAICFRMSYQGEDIVVKSFTPELVEKEVARIRDIYNDIVASEQAGVYSKVTLNDMTTAFLEEGGMVRKIVSKNNSDGYTKSFYYEAGELVFAYLEGQDAHRLYYYNQKLFRWRYSANASNAGEAVNHDNEDSMEFRKYEVEVLLLAMKYYAQVVQ